MSLVTKKELISLKLNSINVELLRELATRERLNYRGSATELKNRLITTDSKKIDLFIKEKYKEQLEERRILVSDKDLIKELSNVKIFKWNTVQGELDRKIQTEYVRKFYKYAELVNAVKNQLASDVLSYVTATWFNHWTTVLIEDHISENKNIIPTIKNNFGVDIFFRDQPFDLKITYVPQGYPISDAIKDPKKLAKWMYENQGEQRFGADNRFFVIVENWEMKRNFDLLYQEIDKFLESADVTERDEIQFTFRGDIYTTVSKILIISK